MWAWVHQAESAFAMAVSSLGKVLLGVGGAHAEDARRVSFHCLEHIPTFHKSPTTPRRLTAALCKECWWAAATGTKMKPEVEPGDLVSLLGSNSSEIGYFYNTLVWNLHPREIKLLWHILNGQDTWLPHGWAWSAGPCMPPRKMFSLPKSCNGKNCPLEHLGNPSQSGTQCLWLVPVLGEQMAAQPLGATPVMSPGCQREWASIGKHKEERSIQRQSPAEGIH